jgi:S-adenosylhomocysteine hydrolase
MGSVPLVRSLKSARTGRGRLNIQSADFHVLSGSLAARRPQKPGSGVVIAISIAMTIMEANWNVNMAADIS